MTLASSSCPELGQDRKQLLSSELEWTSGCLGSCSLPKLQTFQSAFCYYSWKFLEVYVPYRNTLSQWVYRKAISPECKTKS